MPFFQNVFGQEYQGFLNTGNDRNYSLTFKIAANQNNQDYQFAFNHEPYDLSTLPNLTINYAWDVDYKNWSSVTINVSGSVAADTKAFEVAAKLNSNSVFSSMYEARVVKNNGFNHVLVVSKIGRAKQIIKMYISNGGAERKIKFNKKAPVAELPCYFKRDTIENRFNFEPANNHLIMLDPSDAVDAAILTDSGFGLVPKADWELLRGRAAGIYTFKKQTIDIQDRIAEIIEYPAGAVAGDLARQTIYTYTDTNTQPDEIFQIPYCLTSDDLIVPPEAAPAIEGALWGAGEGNHGEMGDNEAVDRSSPVQTICGGSNWASVSCGYYNIAALKSDGTLWTWGQNNDGGLGDNTTDYKSSPVQTVCGGSNWSYLVVGTYYEHCAAIKTDGTLWLWGRNGDGEIGDGTTDDKSSPVQTVAGGSDWKQVASGSSHTAAIKTDGSLWTWGDNNAGQLGNNDTTASSSPTQLGSGTDWSFVDCGNDYMAALKTDGSLWLWGDNNDGTLGVGDSANYSSPVQTICGGTNWSKISCGDHHMTAIKDDGTCWLWGRNSDGQLGNDTTTTVSSPIQTICGGNNWAQVDGGQYHTAALKTDGTCWVWGANGRGQLATNNTTGASSPVQTVMSDNNWLYVNAGYVSTFGIRKA